MNIEHVEKSYQELESDSTLQNLIAQANARYILYNTCLLYTSPSPRDS